MEEGITFNDNSNSNNNELELFQKRRLEEIQENKEILKLVRQFEFEERKVQQIRDNYSYNQKKFEEVFRVYCNWAISFFAKQCSHCWYKKRDCVHITAEEALKICQLRILCKVFRDCVDSGSWTFISMPIDSTYYEYARGHKRHYYFQVRKYRIVNIQGKIEEHKKYSCLCYSDNWDTYITCVKRQKSSRQNDYERVTRSDEWYRSNYNTNRTDSLGDTIYYLLVDFICDYGFYVILAALFIKFINWFILLF